MVKLGLRREPLLPRLLGTGAVGGGRYVIEQNQVQGEVYYGCY